MIRSTVVKASMHTLAMIVGASLAFIAINRGSHENLATFELYQPGKAPWQKRCFVNGNNESSNYVLTEPRQMTGLWEPGFEHSLFTEIDRSGKVIAGRESAWLDANRANISALRLFSLNPRTFRVEIIGREPICDVNSVGHGFGHMAGSTRLIVAEKILKIDEITKPPPPPPAPLSAAPRPAP